MCIPAPNTLSSLICGGIQVFKKKICFTELPPIYENGIQLVVVDSPSKIVLLSFAVTKT